MMNIRQYVILYCNNLINICDKAPHAPSMRAVIRCAHFILARSNYMMTKKMAKEDVVVYFTETLLFILNWAFKFCFKFWSLYQKKNLPAKNQHAPKKRSAIKLWWRKCGRIWCQSAEISHPLNVESTKIAQQEVSFRGFYGGYKIFSICITLHVRVHTKWCLRNDIVKLFVCLFYLW